MEFNFDTALERDIDLLVMEEFSVSEGFARIFLNTVNVKGEYDIVKSIHSKVDAEYGESDIVFIIRTNNKLHALHIEDKINAIAMPNQHERYFLRGKKDVEKGDYDTFSVVILAPQKYLNMNTEAQKYENKVTYEQLLEYFSKEKDVRSMYKAALIREAINEQISGYQWEANPDVVRFCNEMYYYQKERFPGMTKGTVAWWPTFKTIHKNIEVQFKANKGHCDLAFTKTSYSDLYKEYRSKIYGNMEIVETGKSSAIRIVVPPIKFESTFSEVVDDVEEALTAIDILLNFANEKI